MGTVESRKKIGGTEVSEIRWFLNSLRESGVTNMFGAAPYLVEEYGLSRADAKKALMAWMKDFEK